MKISAGLDTLQAVDSDIILVRYLQLDWEPVVVHFRIDVVFESSMDEGKHRFLHSFCCDSSTKEPAHRES